MSPIIPIIVGIVLGVGCLAIASFNYYRKRIIDDLPTSKTKGVFIGLAELKGTAESESPLTSHLAGIKCVQYDWRVEEEWEQMVTHTVTDSEGNTYDFCFGLNWSGVIDDDRVSTYSAKALTEPDTEVTPGDWKE